MSGFVSDPCGNQSPKPNWQIWSRKLTLTVSRGSHPLNSLELTASVGNGTVEFAIILSLLAKYLKVRRRIVLFAACASKSFVCLVLHQEPPITEDAIEDFKVFDRDGHGFVSAAEIRHVMTTMGEKFSEEEADEMIKVSFVVFPRSCGTRTLKASTGGGHPRRRAD